MTDEAKSIYKKGLMQSLPAWAGVGALIWMLVTSFIGFDNKFVESQEQVKFLETQIVNEDVKMALMGDRLKRIEDKLDKYFNEHQK